MMLCCGYWQLYTFWVSSQLYNDPRESSTVFRWHPWKISFLDFWHFSLGILSNPITFSTGGYSSLKRSAFIWLVQVKGVWKYRILYTLLFENVNKTEFLCYSEILEIRGIPSFQFQKNFSVVFILQCYSTVNCWLFSIQYENIFLMVDVIKKFDLSKKKIYLAFPSLLK